MSLFSLKNLPDRKVIEDMARRYPALDVDSTEAFLVLLGVSHGILSAMDEQYSRHNLSQARLRVLIQLLREDASSLSPCELAERMGVTRATVTGLVDGLERDGFVRREETPDDRRSLKVRLLPAGRRLLDSLMPDRYRRIAGLMAGLTTAERRSLVRLLEKVGEGMPAFCREGRR